MVTISICPLCDNKFMFHKADSHLYKTDAFGKYVICQGCYRKELQKKTKTKKSNGTK